jgi:hypothetical protein
MKRATVSELIVALVAMLVIALLFTPTQARANGTPATPTPTPAPTSATANSASTSNGSAKAASGSHSAVGDVSQGLQVGGDSARSWSLFLPPPVFTPPMAPMVGCAPRVTQSAGSITLLGSMARSDADPTDCTLMALRNAKVEACQYASAKQVEDLMLAKLLPGYTASVVAFVDLTPAACAALKAPPKPEPVVNLVAPPLPTATEVALLECGGKADKAAKEKRVAKAAPKVCG